jgi:hypothetical protein
VNIIMGAICLVGFSALLVSLVTHFIVWVFKAGYAQGRADAEKAWTEMGKEVEQTQQAIWREEAK